MQNKRCIESFLNGIWNDKGPDPHQELYEYFSDKLIINSPIGKKTGLSSFVSINDKWSGAFPDMQVSQIEFEVVDNLIITNWKSEATHQQDFQGIPSSGKKVSYLGETYFVFQNDKIVRYSCSIDMPSIYQQLGFYLKQEEYNRQEILVKNKKLLIETLMELCPGHLSKRETECLSLYLCGFNTKQIGKILFISPRTVETHVQRALHEAQCTSKEQCIEFMFESHLLPLWQDLAKTLLSANESRKKSSFS